MISRRLEKVRLSIRVPGCLQSLLDRILSATSWASSTFGTASLRIDPLFVRDGLIHHDVIEKCRKSRPISTALTSFLELLVFLTKDVLLALRRIYNTSSLTTGVNVGPISDPIRQFENTVDLFLCVSRFLVLQGFDDLFTLFNHSLLRFSLFIMINTDLQSLKVIISIKAVCQEVLLESLDYCLGRRPFLHFMCNESTLVCVVGHFRPPSYSQGVFLLPISEPLDLDCT